MAVYGAADLPLLLFEPTEEMGHALDRLDPPGCLEVLQEPETHEPRDGNLCVQGSGLRRTRIDASLSRNYVRRFVEEGLVGAPPEPSDGRRAVLLEGARHR